MLTASAAPVRLAVGSAGQAILQIADAGGELDPAGSIPTVELFRDDGTIAIASAPAIELDTGLYGLTVSATVTDRVDRLTARWTAVLDGSAQTLDSSVEVTGGPLFTVAELRAADVQDGTTEEVELARLLAEDFLQFHTGVALTPRYRRHTMSVSGNAQLLLLDTPLVTEVFSVAISGVELTSDELELIGILREEGMLYRPAGWPVGYSNLEIAWQHGYSQPYALAKRPAMKIAERILTEDRSSISPRATSISNEAGTQMLIVAGTRGMYSDIPEVNAFISGHDFTPSFA